MEKFSEIYKSQIEKYRARKKTLHSTGITFINSSIELKNKIDELLEISIWNESTRAEIIEKITPIINENIERIPIEYREIITADWIYEIARSILAPKTVKKESKTFIIGRRRGPNGGFEVTEITEPFESEAIKTEAEEKNIEEIEKKIEETNIAIEKAEEQGRKLEKFYYPGVLKWAQENGFERCEITGGLIPGPKWENPDLIEMYFDFGRNTFSLNIEVSSFEVKLRIEPQAIWQAAHYSRFSHYTFIAFALTEDEVRAADRVFELAVKFGLGILVLENQDQDEIKFKLIHSPTKNNPASSELEVIISRFLDGERFGTTRKQLIEEKKKFTRNLMQGINFTLGES